MTTNRAPFIEDARLSGQLFIQQPYDRYSSENHLAWSRLYARMLPRWRNYANEHFLRGIDSLALSSDRVPRLDDVNHFLAPLTGFQAKGVSGYIPAFLFFDCLRERTFPTTVTIRDADKLDYLPEPDIFHDVAGHVPMHTDRAFAEALVRFGECAHTAVELTSDIADEHLRTQRLTSIIKAMARFFWFTVEFGLMRGKGELKVYGSGLLSSFGEIEHCHRFARSAALSDSVGMGDQSGLRDRPLPAAAVRGGFVRPSVQPGGHAGKMDARRKAEQRGAG